MKFPLRLPSLRGRGEHGGGGLRFFFCTEIQHLGAPIVIGLARLHAYQNGVFWLVDVPVTDAKHKRRELTRQGWTITHTEIV